MSDGKIRKNRLDDGLTKICKSCLEVKPVSEFYRNSGCSGYRPRCKPCYQEDAQRRARKNGYRTSPEVRGKARKAWEERNPEWRAEYQLRYQRENRERLNARRRENYAKDPSMVLRYVHKRRAALAQAEGDFTAEEWRGLLERSGRKCLRCGSTESLTPDHVIPLSKGGTNYIDNIQPLCRSCNAKKGADSVDYRGTNDHCEIPV